MPQDNDSPSQDLYSILQVDPAAEAEVIDAAYRRLARKYHPDVNHAPDAAERMRDLNTAYSVLGDKAKRAEYDRDYPRRRAAAVPDTKADAPQTRASDRARPGRPRPDRASDSHTHRAPDPPPAQDSGPTPQSRSEPESAPSEPERRNLVMIAVAVGSFLAIVWMASRGTRLRVLTDVGEAAANAYSRCFASCLGRPCPYLAPGDPLQQHTHRDVDTTAATTCRGNAQHSGRRRHWHRRGQGSRHHCL